MTNTKTNGIEKIVEELVKFEDGGIEHHSECEENIYPCKKCFFTAILTTLQSNTRKEVIEKIKEIIVIKRDIYKRSVTGQEACDDILSSLKQNQ